METVGGYSGHRGTLGLGWSGGLGWYLSRTGGSLESPGCRQGGPGLREPWRARASVLKVQS